MKLGEMAAIRTGLVLSRKTSKEVTPWLYRVLTLRSFDPNGTIKQNELESLYATEPLILDYLTQPGDIVIRLTAPYTSVVIDESLSGCVIPSNFVVIRTNANWLIPEYLAWLLNTPEMNKRTFASASRNMLGAVKATYFSDLEIDVLPVSQQSIIAAIYNLSQKETSLIRALADEKERYYALMLDSVQQKMKRGN